MARRANTKTNGRAGQKALKARRRQLNAALFIIAVVLVALVGAVIYQMQFTPDYLVSAPAVSAPAVKQTAGAPDTLTEAQLWQMIIRKEKAFFEFEKRVRSALDSVPEGIFKESALAPFEMVRTNAQKNQFRNWQTLKRNQSALKDSSGRIQTGTHLFYYDFLSPGRQEKYKMPATYEAPRRLIAMGGNTGMFDLLCFHHEVYHVGQDNRVRVKYAGSADADKYLSWHYPKEGEAERARLLFDYELMAEGIELELVDLLAGGYLRQIVKLGKKPDPVILARKLGILQPDETDSLFLHRESFLAQYFFPEGFRTKRFKRDFIITLANVYIKGGFRIFLLKAEDNLEFQEVSIKDLEKLPELIPVGW